MSVISPPRHFIYSLDLNQYSNRAGATPGADGSHRISCPKLPWSFLSSQQRVKANFPKMPGSSGKAFSENVCLRAV